MLPHNFSSCDDSQGTFENMIIKLHILENAFTL